jgi:hypothetical protein
MFLPVLIFYLIIQLEPGFKAVSQQDSLPLDLDSLSSSVSSSQETGPLVTQDFLGLLQTGENDVSPCKSELLEPQVSPLNIETRKRDQLQGKQRW